MNSKQRKQTAKAYFATQPYRFPRKGSKRTEERIKNGARLRDKYWDFNYKDFNK